MSKAALLGTYWPIALCAAIVCALLITRWLVPVLKQKRPIVHLYLGLSALCSTAAHMVEGSVFGVARWLDRFDFINHLFPLLLGGKVLILGSIVFALAALMPGNTVRSTLGLSTGLVLVLWAAGTAMALLR